VKANRMELGFANECLIFLKLVAEVIDRVTGSFQLSSVPLGAVSRQVREIFLRHTDLIEPLSLDEAYLELSKIRRDCLPPHR
jgi:hypothetical protein